MGLFGSEKQRLQNRLHTACQYQQLEKLRKVLAAGADPNDPQWNDCPLLLRALDDGFPEGARLLLAHKADPNGRQDKRTCLHVACAKGEVDIVARLLDLGAEIGAVNAEGRTALHEAAAYGRGNVVRLLLERGIDRNVADNRMNIAADVAQSHFPRVAELIRDWGKKAAAPAAVRAPQPEAAEGWRLTAKDEVCNTVERKEIGYRLTEIFNFGSGTYTRIAANLATGAESQSLRFFDEFTDHAPIDRAREALKQLGGRDVQKRDKPALGPAIRGDSP